MAPLADEITPGKAAERSADVKTDDPVFELEKPNLLVGHRQHYAERLVRLEAAGWRRDSVEVERASRPDELAEAPLAGKGKAFLYGHATLGPWRLFDLWGIVRKEPLAGGVSPS